jgi:ribonuclease HI/transposase InsO family protein
MLDGSGAGVVLKSPKGDTMCYVLQIHFNATNNVAEYEALMHGMHIAKDLGVTRLLCYGDSDLVVQQLDGTWDAKSPTMAEYRRTIDEFGRAFQGFEVKHIKRDENEAADALARMGSKRSKVPSDIFLEHLYEPSIKGGDLDNPKAAKSVAVFATLPDWTLPYIKFLVDQELPEDEVLRRQVVRRAKAYTVINGELYKRSTTGVYQRCVSQAEGVDILNEIHSGCCGHHASAKAIVSKAFRHGFYWLTAKQDADEIVKTCVGCQKYARQPKMPAQELRTIPITWPFAVWGLDMVGPFRTARGSLTHLLVAVDKYTKWVEAKPVAKVDGATATKFVIDIITRFGVPHSIITDNGTNFAVGELARYCEDVGIRLDLASVAHPQSNGQVERMNGIVLQGIKPRLEVPLHRAAGAWVEELPAVLWSIRTTPNRSTGYTPFFLIYGAEAVLPTDVLHDTPRVAAYVEADAEEARQDGLDLLEEEREIALQRSAIYQQDMRRYHSRRVRHRSFREGDMVLRLVQQKEHKLAPTWEGPFVISKALKNGAYYLVDLRDLKKKTKRGRKRKRNEEAELKETKRPWNIEQLRPFYT